MLTAARARILLVEDDPAIARTICYSLERENLAVVHSLQLSDARQQWAIQSFSMLILDVGLPDGNGLDWCRGLRAAGTTAPILVLSARAEEMDRVLGLELGADDYLTKPFSPRELVARVRAMLRRAQYAGAATQPEGDRPASLALDLAGQRILLSGHVLALTRREYQLLRYLMERPGRILSRESLLDTVWGQDSDSTDRTVDTHIKTLRAKLREADPAREYISTHRGMGYCLDI